MNKTKLLLAAMAFVIFLGGAYFVYSDLSEKHTDEFNQQTREKTGETEEKTPAPDFTVIDVNGDEINLSSFAGKPVVLNFWASWCPPCKSEMPHFNSVYEAYKDKAEFLMVDLVDGQRETVEKGSDYILSRGYTFPVYYDTENSAGGAYGISSIPTTVFIDKDGYIVSGYQGPISEDTLKNNIDFMIEGESGN